MDFAKEYKKYQEAFEVCLAELAAGLSSPSAQLLEATRYALLGGGKRLRPVLFLAIFHHFSLKNCTKGDTINSLFSHVGNMSASSFDIAGGATSLSGGCPQFSRECDAVSRDSAVCDTAKYGETSPSALLGDAEIAKTQLFLSGAEQLACAIECLHTYTLVHDDLPCMDDDDFRRGRPSCHKKFGEAIALLAGDSLLNLCYELLFKAAASNPRVAVGCAEFAALLGAEGLVGGQAVELCLSQNPHNPLANSPSENLNSVPTDLEQTLLEICKNKTAALFVASAALAGRAAGCDEVQLSLLRDFAENFGFAFQLKDDLSDMNVGSYAHTFGKEKTQKLVESYSAAALTAARAIGSPFLECFIDFEKYL